MAKNDFLPRTDETKVLFMNNLNGKLPGYAGLLGVTGAQLTSLANDTSMWSFIVNLRENYKTKTQEVTGYKNLLRDGPLGTPPGPVPSPPAGGGAPTVVAEGMFFRIRKLIVFIKAAPNYNSTIGEDLGIVGDENTIDPETLKPILIGALDASRPLIKWTKGSVTSIDIYVERTPGAGFTFLANDTQPDYIDTVTLPDGVNSAVWNYKAIYKIGDEQVGEFSEVISITVTREVV